MTTEHPHAGEYVLGHSTKELERLIGQAELHDPSTLQFFHDAGIKPGTLAGRISEEAVAVGATLMWCSLVGAVVRKPGQPSSS